MSWYESVAQGSAGESQHSPAQEERGSYRDAGESQRLCTEGDRVCGEKCPGTKVLRRAGAGERGSCRGVGASR